MFFHPTPLVGAYVIELDKKGDDRGFFARVFCQNEFEKQGLVTQFVQVNNSLSAEKGTLRGMHYQLAPKAESKVLRCIRGSIWDCILDLRPDSPTFSKWHATELSAENRKMMYVPKGCAHGFLTLEPDTEVFYLTDEFFTPEMERGVRWNDPTFGIEWPLSPSTLSEKDANLPDFDSAHDQSTDSTP